MKTKRMIIAGKALFFLALTVLLGSCAGTGASEEILPEELAGTLWLTPICGMPSEGDFAEEGFFLSEDGSLKYVNIFSMTGDAWRFDEEGLVLTSHTERYPEGDERVLSLVKKDGVISESPVKGEDEMTPPSARRLLPEIPEGRWVISVMPNPESVSEDYESAPYMEITDDESGLRIRGNGGVNGFGGSLALDGFSWKSGPMMRTMMAGPGLSYEDLFMLNLDRADSYLLIDDSLFLYEGTELILILAKDTL
ncbi:MAG: META domain-containing protein [Spirochaetales bacterium]|nr:META domain-containing protein [Spirochaetales bacterium]